MAIVVALVESDCNGNYGRLVLGRPWTGAAASVDNREPPVVDEEEYAAAFRLYGDCMKGTKELRGSGMFRWKA